MQQACASASEDARRTWAVALLLCACLLRGLLPVGWMPAMAADGPRLVICTAQGLVAAADAAQSNGEQAPPAATNHSLCVFAASGTPMLAAVPALVAAFGGLALAAAPPTGPPAPAGDRRGHLRPPAQAPPTLR